MAEPRLTLVDAALRETEPFAGVPEGSIRKILERYGPSIAKRARQEERTGIYAAHGKQALDEFSQCAVLRVERDERPTQGEMAHAKKAARNMGVVFGAIGGAAAVIVASAILLLIGAEINSHGAITGSQIERQSDNVRALNALDEGGR